MTPSRRTRVFIICPGIGHVNRGFETFTRECFEALRQDVGLDLYLFKGAGTAAKKEQVAWCLRRGGATARVLGLMLHRDAYYAEQVSFALGLIPFLVRLQPEVVYFSDGVVGNMLWRWRRLTRGGFKLLLSNGGPLGPPLFPRFDHVHQVLEKNFCESAKSGRTAGTQTLLPYGFDIRPEFRRLRPDELASLRNRLGLPNSRPVVLTVGAINSSHKRMDYVIREIASLPVPRPFLLMLGQPDHETPKVLSAANKALGTEGYQCRTVPAAQIGDFYKVADVFALGSLEEGFGRVLVEALSHGLPCLAADQPFAREVLGECGYFGDFSRPGGLAELLIRVLTEASELGNASSRHADAYDRLSWDRLHDRYVDMILRCARA